MIIGKAYHFDAAHFLPDYKGACANLHGHTWKLEISITHEKPEEQLLYNKGILLDFHELNRIISTNVLSFVDHKNLNDLFPFIPTCENLISWMRRIIEDNLPVGFHVSSIKLQEGEGGFAKL